jgi:choline dehydrogenase-like flavoprotein
MKLMHELYDVMIVGSGAGGSTAFLELSGSGKVLLVEEGEAMNTNASTSPVEIIDKFYRNSGVQPVFGFPSYSIGEGVVLGGSTEINGGLIWRTPNHTLRSWRNQNFDFANSPKMEEIFSELEEELSVITESSKLGENVDSSILKDAAQRLGMKVAPARRAVRNCRRKNVCPIGCPSGAKQSMNQTFIPWGVKKGGEVITGWKAVKIRIHSRYLEVDFEGQDGARKRIKAKQLVLSCGAIQTHRLLSNSGVLRKRIHPIQVHLNNKIIAKFSFQINSRLGTIFTDQVQEFMEDGFLFMPANFQEEFLALASANVKAADYKDILEQQENYGLYTGQFQVNSKIMDVRIFRKTWILLNYLSKSDLQKMRKYLMISSNLLFEAGAEFIHLPIQNTPKCYSLDEVIKKVNKLKRVDLLLSCVHVMSSIPISPKSRIIDCDARLMNEPRIRIFDSSILPSSVGESPQGSIMAITRFILRKQSM